MIQETIAYCFYKLNFKGFKPNTVLLRSSIWGRFCVGFSFPLSSKRSAVYPTLRIAVFHHPLTTYILSSAISDACSAPKEPLRSLVTYHKKTPQNSKTTYVQLQPAKSGSRLLLQDGTANLPYTSLLQRTHSHGKRKTKIKVPHRTRYKSWTPTFERDIIWIGLNCFQVR